MYEDQRHQSTEQVLKSINLDALIPIEDREGKSELQLFVEVFGDVTDQIDAEAMILSFPTSAGMNADDSYVFMAENLKRAHRSAVLDSERQDEQIVAVGTHAVELCRAYLAMSEEEKVALSEDVTEAYDELKDKLGLFLEAAYVYDTYTGERSAQLAQLAIHDISLDEIDAEVDPFPRNEIRAVVAEIIEGTGAREEESEGLIDRIDEMTSMNPLTMAKLLEERLIDGSFAEIIEAFLDRWYMRPELNIAKLQELKDIVKSLHKYGADTDLLYAVNGLPVGERAEEMVDRVGDYVMNDLYGLIIHFTGKPHTVDTPTKYFSLTQQARMKARNEADRQLDGDRYDEKDHATVRFGQSEKIVLENMPILATASPDVTISGESSQGRTINVFVTTDDGMEQFTTYAIRNTPYADIMRLILHERTHALRAEIGRRLEEAGYEGSATIPLGLEEFYAQVAEACFQGTGVDLFDNPEATPYPDSDKLTFRIMGTNMSNALKYATQIPKGIAIYRTLQMLENVGDDASDETLISNMNSTIQATFAQFFDKAGIAIGNRSLARDFSVPMDGLRYIMAGAEGTGQNPLITQAIDVLYERARGLGVDESPLSDRRIRAIFYSLMVYLGTKEEEEASATKVPLGQKIISYLQDVTVDDAVERLGRVGIVEEEI